MVEESASTSTEESGSERELDQPHVQIRESSSESSLEVKTFVQG